ESWLNAQSWSSERGRVLAFSIATFLSRSPCSWHPRGGPSGSAMASGLSVRSLGSPPRHRAGDRCERGDRFAARRPGKLPVQSGARHLGGRPARPATPVAGERSRSLHTAGAVRGLGRTRGRRDGAANGRARRTSLRNGRNGGASGPWTSERGSDRGAGGHSRLSGIQLEPKEYPKIRRLADSRFPSRSPPTSVRAVSVVSPGGWHKGIR